MNLVALYLAAILAANLLVARFGPGVSIVTAAVFIGLDFSTRDALHDRWRSALWLRMGLLIAAGSALSWLVNRGAGRIALASMVAFAAAGIVDALTFHLLRRRSWTLKANGSNVLAAVVDSFVFPAIAFGGFLPLIVAGQLAAKIGGGAVWAWILSRREDRALSGDRLDAAGA